MGIEDKIKNLNHDQRKIYEEELRGIFECKDNCILYGVKDYVNLPKSDEEMVMEKLYNQMFEKSGKSY